MAGRGHLTVIDGGRSIFDEILTGPFRPAIAPVAVCNETVANEKQPTDRLGNVTELFHGSTTTTKPEH